MMTAREILKTNHSKQISWLNNQLSKANDSIFLNPVKAKQAYKKLESESLVINDSDIEIFMTRYLSESGMKKLITTLRVSLNREKPEIKLEVRISHKNAGRLDALKAETGLSKKEIINKLIFDAYMERFE